jgi:predicted permease
MGPAEARRSACRDFGWAESLKEKCREQRGVLGIEELVRDVRFGLRMLLKNPGFTLVTVLTLALGIGANTAIFSLTDTFLLRNLPVDAPHRLFFLSPAGGRGIASTFNFATFDYLRDHDRGSADILAYREVRLRTGNGQTRQLVTGQMVSGNYFSALGVKPIRGRLITREDDRQGSEAVAVISHRFSQSHSSADAVVLGSLLDLNGVACTVVGITPTDFFGTDATAMPDVFVAIQMQSRLEPTNADLLTSFGLWPFTLMARLNPGMSPQQLAANLTVSFQQILAERGKGTLREADMHDIPNRKVVLRSSGKGLSNLRQKWSKPLFILTTVTGSILLIACANVANLLLSRAGSRQKEIAVRFAIGANRTRLIRQLMTESVMLAGLGGACGLIVAIWSKHLLMRLLPEETAAFAGHVALDSRVICFAALITFCAVALFGVLPSLRITRVDLAATLKAAGQNLSSSSERLRLGNALVVTQVALSLVVLVAAGLFVRSMWELREVNLGFNSENVALVTIKPSISGYDEKQLDALVGRLIDPQLIKRLEARPGVQSAALCSSKPIADLPWWYTSLDPLDGSFEPKRMDKVYLNSVSPGFFHTLAIDVLQGRGFTDEDRHGFPTVGLINETLATRYFGKQDPLHKRFALPGTPFKDIEVVGVVKDSRVRDPRSAPPSLIYMPFAQFPSTEEMKFAVLATQISPSVIDGIRKELESVDTNLVIERVETVRGLVDGTLLQERSLADLTTSFGLLGLLLAAVGLYGIVAQSVGRRTNEIGLRMALGADRRAILKTVMREGLNLIVIGIVVGLAISFVLTRLISTQLFGISPLDPLTIACVSLFLTAVALIACFLPARRATNINPILALRYE